MRLPLAVIFVLCNTVTLLTGGCASTYESRYRFEPRPASVELRQRGTEQAVARTLASIVGVRTRTSVEVSRPAVEARLRIENVSDAPLSVDLERLFLISADLREFEPPIVTVEGGPDGMIPPDAVRTVTAIFPFPADSRDAPLDLSTITLQWTLVRETGPTESEQTFTLAPMRRWRSPYHYHRPHTHFHFGAGYHF